LNREQPLKEVVTVAEMARLVGLSRARFYQLVTAGIFIPPARNATTGRPFYSREQQAQCLEIRRINRGANGQPMLFYATVPKPAPVGRRAVRASRPTPNSPAPHGELDQLRNGLAQLGLRDVADARLRSALAEISPNVPEATEPAALLAAVYRHLKRQNSPDNVTR
jgi:hypothetical protein